MAALIGVSCVHGIALGSPVVPDENRTLVIDSGSAATGENGASSPRKSSHHTSPGSSAMPPPVSTTTRRAGRALTAFSYIGSSRPARSTRSWVTTPTALVIASRVAISSEAKLSAIDTTTPPKATMPR